MKVLRRVVVGVVAAAVVFTAVGYVLPSKVKVSRFVYVNAPPSQVFVAVNSLRAVSHWSPWLNREGKAPPGTKPATFRLGGPDAGAGQTLSWVASKPEASTGSMKILKSVKDKEVALDLSYGAVRHAKSALTIRPVDQGATVTWALTYDLGSNPIVRYFGLIVPSAISFDFERGLFNLKHYVEALPRADFSGLEVTRVSVEPKALISTDATPGRRHRSMSRMLSDSYERLTRVARSAGLSADGHPIFVAKESDASDQEIETSLPVAKMPEGVKLPEDVRVGATKPGLALRVTQSDEDALEKIHEQLKVYALTSGWKVRGSAWNEYVGNPSKRHKSPVGTNVYLPIE